MTASTEPFTRKVVIILGSERIQITGLPTKFTDWGLLIRKSDR